MKRFLKICVVMFVFFTFISCEENDGVITVNGTGEITFLPDVINLRVEIKNICWRCHIDISAGIYYLFVPGGAYQT